MVAGEIMKKSKQLTGTEVINPESGEVIGRVKDTLFLPGDKKIRGLLISCRRWIKSLKILIIEDIKAIGNDAILIKSSGKLIECEKLPWYKDATNEKKRVMGLKLITKDGEELGFIEDIIVNEKDCTIEGYVLTDGIIEDIIKGKIVIPSTDEIVFGKDAVFISSDCRNIILKNDISLKRVLKKTGEEETK